MAYVKMMMENVLFGIAIIVVGPGQSNIALPQVRQKERSERKKRLLGFLLVSPEILLVFFRDGIGNDPAFATNKQ